MKHLIFLLLALSSLTLSNCASDDEDATQDRVANVKFEALTSRNTEAIITRTLNNDLVTEEVESMPYSFTYAQQAVPSGTYLKLSFQENGEYVASSGGDPGSWTDYELILNIWVDDEVVKTETFDISDAPGTQIIDYTFN